MDQPQQQYWPEGEQGQPVEIPGIEYDTPFPPTPPPTTWTRKAAVGFLLANATGLTWVVVLEGLHWTGYIGVGLLLIAALMVALFGYKPS